MKVYSIKKHKGFTLIELLVVIAIIGILSSVVLSSLNSARLKARNVARITQLKQIKTAMALYYDDHGSYPYVGTVPGNFRSDCGWGHQNDPNNIIPGLVPDYIAKITSDPTLKYIPGVSYQSCLMYESDGEDYSVFLYHLHDPSPGYPHFDHTVYPAFIDPNLDGTPGCTVELNNPNSIYAWKVYSDNACRWWE